MINLIGTYECKIDVKGRLMLPVNLKKQLGEHLNESFIVKRSVFQNCLELHPYSEWKLTMEKLNKLNRFVKKNNDFIRRYNAGVRIIDLDNNGRLLIPKDISKLYFSNNFKPVLQFSSFIEPSVIYCLVFLENFTDGFDLIPLTISKLACSAITASALFL